jgi:hypothetical protein
MWNTQPTPRRVGGFSDSGAERRLPGLSTGEGAVAPFEPALLPDQDREDRQRPQRHGQGQ